MHQIGVAIDMKYPSRNELIGKELMRRNLLSRQAYDVCVAEIKVTQQSMGRTLVQNGFIKQSLLNEVLQAIGTDSLSNEQLIAPHVPAQLLIDLKCLLAAQTADTLYLSTMSPVSYVREKLQPFFPTHKFEFFNPDPVKIENYLELLNQISDSDNSVMEQHIRSAINERASDIHIEPRRNSYSIFFRKIGVRHHQYEGTLDEYNSLIARIKDRSKMDLAEKRIAQDGSFNIDINGRLVDLRVSCLPITGGEKIVIRILDPDKVHVGLDTIGITNIAAWRQGVSRPNGLCLICGPTGSGKTTTLHATATEMNRFENAIITIEDPVEYHLPFVSQVNVNEPAGLTFSSAIRAAMRQNPDVIIVGEVRDSDTARNAIKGAVTGHMVLATLHTDSIKTAVGRLKDLGIDPFELKGILRAVLVQTLVRTTCKTCYGKDDSCPICKGIGYDGATAISECHYFANTDEVVELLDSSTVKWRTMIEDIYDKYMEGVTDENEFVRVFGQEAIDMLNTRGRRKAE